MSVNINLNQSQPASGLQTFTWTAPSAMPITVTLQAFLPASSGLEIVINQNGSPLVTVGGSASNPSPTQQIISASTQIICASADVITVVMTSSNAIDSVANALKSIVSLYQIF